MMTGGTDAAAPVVAAPALAPVHELVREQAKRRPEAPALDGLSYRDLDAWSDRIAVTLVENGVRDGRSVALRLNPGPRHIAALLGVLKAGGCLLPLGTGEPLARCVDVITANEPACLLVESVSETDALMSWYRAKGPVLAVPGHDESRFDAGSARLPGVDLDARAYVVQTSGTTGRPKGIAQSHRGLAQFVRWMGAEFRMGPGRRTAQWAAPNYDAGLCEIFATLVAGGTLCPVPRDIRFDAGHLITWLAEQRVNVLQTVPSFGRELRHALGSAPVAPDLTPLDHLLFAGEPLSGDLVDGLAAVLPRARMVNLYGTSETILATWLEVTGRWSGTVPIGQAIPGRSILVLDAADRPCPAGVAGEIVVCSPFLALGYVGETVSSGFGTTSLPTSDGAAREVRSYRTGDLGRWRADGLLEFLGRRDRQVKLRGIRVEPAEIEASLLSHPTVVDCVVVPTASEGDLVRQLVAYVVPASGEGTPDQWRGHLREKLGAELLPSSFVTLARLPRNVGGKVDTSALPAPRDEARHPEREKSASRAGDFRSWSAALARRDDDHDAQGDSKPHVRP